MLKDLVHKVPIASIVSRRFDLDGHGRYLRGKEHDSLVIDTQKNRFYWNSIGVFGNALDWLVKIEGQSVVDATSILQEYSDIPFRNNFELLLQPRYPYYKLADAFWRTGKNYRTYWYSRGYSDDTIDKFKLGHTGKHYVIPIIHEDKLLNFQCIVPPTTWREKRVWNWTRGLGKQPFNFKALSNTDWVIITEGPVDAIIATQFGYPAISLMPNALNWNHEYTQYLTGIKTVYLMFDNDEAGLRGMRKIGKQLWDRVLVIDWDGYPEKTDIGDVLTMDNPYDKMDTIIHNCLPYSALESGISWKWYKNMNKYK